MHGCSNAEIESELFIFFVDFFVLSGKSPSLEILRIFGSASVGTRKFCALKLPILLFFLVLHLKLSIRVKRRNILKSPFNFLTDHDLCYNPKLIRLVSVG